MLTACGSLKLINQIPKYCMTAFQKRNCALTVQHHMLGFKPFLGVGNDATSAILLCIPPHNLLCYTIYSATQLGSLWSSFLRCICSRFSKSFFWESLW
mmetsp:Transcript_74554/g.124336  ORF Transcript_74554/g.124336 Transcript_74554/m.124336 type:complete len:98 (-) Transcript_74554:322-615(-)